MNYQKLFEPIKIGQLTVKNRIEAAPSLPCMAAPDGHATKELIDYYKAKAKGGAGIVTVGESPVDADYAISHAGQLNIGSDMMIPTLAMLAEAIKRYGAIASLELCHGGRQTLPSIIGGKNPIAPSPIPSKFHEILAGHPIVVEEMTREMIEQVIENYAAAAFRLKRAGFDMCMIHGGHGWLLAQFLSPFSNRRTDEYGGSLENRARFPIEILKRIRERVGPGFAIEYRMSGEELVPGGLTLDEAVKFAKMIEDKVDCLQMSIGMMAMPETTPAMHPPYYMPRGRNVYLAERMKKELNIPVTALGAIIDPDMAEAIISEGKADMVAMARTFMADPAFPEKVRTGRQNEIIPCTRCLECLGKVAVFLPIRCAMNPVTGRETECSMIQPSQTKKRVAVVGGGPAGMQAAITAATRGHEVTLYERSDRLGGNLNIVYVPAFKEDGRRFSDYLLRKVKSLPIDVRLSTEVTAKTIAANKPDVLILAVGADPLIPALPGIAHANVAWAGDILNGKFQAGASVVIVGGGLVGCETALHLGQQGKSVVVVEMLDQVAVDMNPISRVALLDYLQKAGVQIRTQEKLVEINDRGIKVVDKAGQAREIDADTVVLAMGMAPRKETVAALQNTAPDVRVIGDCGGGRKIIDAIHAGFNTAVEI